MTAAVALAAPGDVDPTFGDGGMAFVDVPGQDSADATGVEVDSQGRVVLAGDFWAGNTSTQEVGGTRGSSGSRLAIARLTPDGAPDPSFGDGGLKTDGLGLGGQDIYADALAIGAGDKPIIGTAWNGWLGFQPALAPSARSGQGDRAPGDFTLLRYTAAGERDETFDDDGVVFTPLGEESYGNSWVAGLVPYADGSIAAAGSLDDGDTDRSQIALARYLDSGELDTAFNPDGPQPGTLLDLPLEDGELGKYDHEVFGVVEQAGSPAGSLLVAVTATRSSERKLVLVRYTATGARDTSFSEDGIAVHDSMLASGDAGGGLAADAEGRILVANEPGWVVRRFDPQGGVDQSWGTAGTVTIPDLSAEVDGWIQGGIDDLAVQPNGKVLASGRDRDGHLSVVRLLSDGSLDPSFGQGGVVTFDTAETYGTTSRNGVALQPGKIILGASFRTQDQRGVAARRATPPAGWSSIGAIRLDGDPLPVSQPDPQPQPQPQAEPQPVPQAAADQPVQAATVPMPSAKRCVSRRSFRIRVRAPRGTKAVSAVVLVNGKKVKVLRGARLRAAVDLRGLPKGRVSVKLEVKLSDGRTVKGERQYRTCTPKRTTLRLPPL